MQPIEIDVAAGIHGSRATWHREVLAHIDPQAFVAALQQWVGEYLCEAERQVTAVRTSVRSEVATQPSGSVVSEGEGVAASSSRAATPEPEKPRGRTSRARVEDEPEPPRLARAEQRRKDRIAQHLKERGVA